MPANTTTPSPRSPLPTRTEPRPAPSKQHPDPDPFPIHLRLTRSLSRVPSSSLHRPPTRNDGLDNNPPPLPASPKQLERMLSGHPDLERQMGVNDEEVGPPPEGGLQAWCCVAAAFTILFCIFGFVTSFGQLKSYYLENQLSEYSQSDVAWMGTLQTFLTFSMSIFSGRYFDSHGARLITVIGTLVSVIALIGLAFCTEYYQFILAHALFGISGTILYSPTTAVSGHWFMRKRSTAVGIVVCGAGGGGVVYPIALKKLFEKLSFRDSILIIAGMNAALMFPSWFFLKARLPPRQPPPVQHMKRPWKQARYTCLVAGSAIVMLNVFSPYFNAPTLFDSNDNLSQTIASYSIAILQAGSMIGRVMSGALADKFGVWTVFIISIVASSVSIFAFWVPSSINNAAAVVGLVSYGAFSGAWIVLVAASCGAISPTREFGMRLGMLWTTASVLALAGPVICGLMISSSGTFKNAGLFVGSTHMLGAVVTIAPRLLEVLRDWWHAVRGKSGESYRMDEKNAAEAAR